MTRLLEGEVMPEIDQTDVEIGRLRRQVHDLTRERDDARIEARRAREDAERALSALRRQLSPLYRALQAVFGELDAAGVTEDGAPAGAAPAAAATRAGSRDAREMALWDDWKAKLPSVCGRVIDTLLLHSDLSVKQIMAAAHMGENSVYQATSKLGQLGLIAKTSGRFSLKQL